MNKNDEFITAFAQTIGKGKKTARKLWNEFAAPLLSDSDKDAVEMVGASNGVKEGEFYLRVLRDRAAEDVPDSPKENSVDSFYDSPTNLISDCKSSRPVLRATIAENLTNRRKKLIELASKLQ